MSAHVVAALHSKLSSQRRDGALLLRHLVVESSDGAFRREHARWLSGLMHVLRADDELAPARAAALLALAALVERSAAFAQEQRTMAGALQRIIPVQVRALPSLGSGHADVVRALIDVMDAAGSNLKPFGPRLEAAVLLLLSHEDAELRAAASTLLARLPYLSMGSASGFAEAWLQLVARVLGSLDMLAGSVVGGYDGGGSTFGVDGMPALELALPNSATIDEELDAAANGAPSHSGNGSLLAVGAYGGGGESGGEERPDEEAIAAAVLAAVEAGENTPSFAPPRPYAAAEGRVAARTQRLVESLCACLCSALQPAPSASGRLCGAANPPAAVPPVPVPVRALVRLASRVLLASGMPRLNVPPAEAFPETSATAVLPAFQAGMADVLAALCATAGSAALAHCDEIGSALSAPLSSLALGLGPGQAAGSAASAAGMAGVEGRGEPGWVAHTCRLLLASSHVAVRLGSSAHGPLATPALEFCVDVLTAALHAQAQAAARLPCAAGAGAGGAAEGGGGTGAGFEEVPAGWSGGRRSSGGGSAKKRRRSGSLDSSLLLNPEVSVTRAALSRPALIAGLGDSALTALLHAALRALPPLLAVAGTLQPAGSRLALEQLLVALLGLVNSPLALLSAVAGRAAGGGKRGAGGGSSVEVVAPSAGPEALDAIMGRAGHSGGGRVAGWRQSAAVHCALLEALGASFCCPYALHPPMLAACLPLLAASRRAAEAQVAACAARVLCSIDCFLHPRLAPAATPRLAVETWASAAAQCGDEAAAAAASARHDVPTAAEGGAVHAASAALAAVRAGLAGPGCEEGGQQQPQPTAQQQPQPADWSAPPPAPGEHVVAPAAQPEAAAEAAQAQAAGSTPVPVVATGVASAAGGAPACGPSPASLGADATLTDRGMTTAASQQPPTSSSPHVAAVDAQAVAPQAGALVAAQYVSHFQADGAKEAGQPTAEALPTAMLEEAADVSAGARNDGEEEGEEDGEEDEGDDDVRAGAWDDSDDEMGAIPPIVFAPPDA